MGLPPPSLLLAPARFANATRTPVRWVRNAQKSLCNWARDPHVPRLSCFTGKSSQHGELGRERPRSRIGAAASDTACSTFHHGNTRTTRAVRPHALAALIYRPGLGTSVTDPARNQSSFQHPPVRAPEPHAPQCPPHCLAAVGHRYRPHMVEYRLTA